MGRFVVIGLCVLAACGRIGFDPEGGSGDAQGGSSPPTLGLVGWWKLDESSGTTAADSAGMAPGMFFGTGLTWQPTGGKIDGALYVPGASGKVLLGMAGALANLPGVTIAAWIQPATVTTNGSYQCFVDKGETSVGGWSIDLGQVADGDLLFSTYYGTGNEVHRRSIGGVVAAGQWARVVATWDGSNAGANIHIYVDGVETAYAEVADATGARPDDSGITASIGCGASSGGFVGLIDDVRLYDRALSPAEVGQL
jgi:hypothetical protein